MKLIVTGDDSQTDCGNVCVGTAVYTHQKEYKRLEDLPFDDILLTKAKLQNSPAKKYKRWIVEPAFQKIGKTLSRLSKK